MATHLLEKHKRYYRIANTGKGYCGHCKRTCKGQALVFQLQDQPSIDGQRSFMVFFHCDAKGHLTRKGWTRDVDFNEIYGRPDANPEYINQEELKAENDELQEFLERDDIHGKKFF